MSRNKETEKELTEGRINRKEYIKFILETVETLKDKGEFSWARVAEESIKEYPEEETNMERVRSLYRYHKNTSKYRDKKLKEKGDDRFSREGIEDLELKLLTSLKRKFEVNNLAARLGLTLEQLLTEVSKLELKGYSINKWKENGKPFMMLDRDKRFKRDINTVNLEAEAQIKFLVIGDTHIGHKLSQIDFMREVINDAYIKGVRTVLHTGDVTEGHYQSIRPTSIRELNAIGFDEQLSLAEQVFPRLDGLTYYAISGNHDASFDRNAFANPVKTLAKLRDDFKYLGHNFAKITINESLDIVLNHPTDGIGQNYGLKLMQYIDRNKEDRLGRFIFMGHYHKFTHLHYKGIDAWITPSMLEQTEFMSSKNLESVVGAILMTVNFNEDGEITTFTPEYYFLD